MPRVSREQTDRNRAAIEAVSSRLFRELGIRAVSVADLMGAAGLTHGGFYGHFASKDEVAAVACSRAFEQSANRWRDRAAGKADKREAFSAIVEGYLTRQNRDDPGNACPSAAMASDIGREPAGALVRRSYLDGVKQQVDTLAGLQDSGDADLDRKQAVNSLALLIGAMVLARATSGDGLSSEFLNAAKERLLAGECPAHPGNKASASRTSHSTRKRAKAAKL